MPFNPQNNEKISSALFSLYIEFLHQLVSEKYPPALLIWEHFNHMSSAQRHGFIAEIHHNKYPPNNLGGRLKALYVSRLLTHPETPRE